MTRKLLAAVALLSGVGCLEFNPNGRYACDTSSRVDCVDSLGGVEGNTPKPDGGGMTPPNSGTDGGPPPTTVPTVTGRRRQRGVLPQSEQTRQVDNTANALQALVFDGGVWTTYPGTYDATTGSFSISGVPEGSKYMVRAAGDIAVSPGAFVDFDALSLGRLNAGTATLSPTSLVINAGGLTPWKATDRLQVASFGARLRFYTPNGPAVNANALTNFSVDFSTNRERLVDGAQGDRVEIHQMSGFSGDGGYNYVAVTKTFRADPFTMTDGQVSTLNGAFVDTPLGPALNVDWRRSEFDVFKTATVPALASVGTVVSVRSLPNAQAQGAYDTGPSLFYCDVVNVPGDVQMTVSYGNPYPGVEQVAEAFTSFRTTYGLPGASVMTFNANITVVDTPETLFNGPIRPRVSPAQNVRINGISASVAQTGVGTTPTLTWDAPAIGSPNAYKININELVNEGGRTTSRFTHTFVTTDRQLTIPPGILVQGKQYFFALLSYVDPGRSPARPFLSRLPMARADVLSAQVSP